MADMSTSILSNTLPISRQWIRKNIPSMLTKANGAFQMFYERRQKVPSSTWIQIPINPKAISSAGAINGTTDTINVNPQQQLTWGTLDWKKYYYSVGVTLDEMAKAGSSPEAIVDLIQTKALLSANDFIRALSSDTHLSGYTTRVLNLNGLADMAAASGTTYAGILNTNTALFASSTDWLFDIDSTTQTVSSANINKMLQRLRAKTQGIFKQDGKPYTVDTIISNEAVYAEIQNSSTYPSARFNDLDDVEAGIKKFAFNGCTWYTDAYCDGTKDGSTADNHLYLLCSESMNMYYVYGFDEKSPFDKENEAMFNQPIQFSSDYYVLNLACNNRRVNGVFTTLVA